MTIETDFMDVSSAALFPWEKNRAAHVILPLSNKRY